MPELPEVETTRRGLIPHLKNKVIQSVTVLQPKLRWPIPATLETLLVRKTLKNLHRRGKYLLFEFTHGTLLCHLGMSGSLRLTTPNAPLKKHDHVLITLGQQQLRFHDPRRFGCILWTQATPSTHPLLAHLGPEPLSDAFNAGYLHATARTRRVPIKSYIMDSKVVVGVGNIYACESLFLAGVHPTRPANKLSLARCESLVTQIKARLHAAIDAGGTTLKDFVNGNGQPGYFQQQLLVYGRAGQPCKQCQRPLKSCQLAGRSTVYCGTCQR